MSMSPLAYADSLRIGTIDFVSPDEIKVLLDIEAPDGVALAAGAFDDPAGLAPWVQYGVERKLPYVDGLSALPQRRTEEDEAAAAFLAGVVSFQHPDHDTTAWPPR